MSSMKRQLKEALVELKAKESLLGDMKGTLEQLELLQQQRDTEVKSLKLQVFTMRAENTTLAAEKANAVDEATRAALESKSLLEDVQALNSKYNTLNAESQSMNLKFKAMEKDVVDCFLKADLLKDRKIKALEDKIEALTNAANEAVVAKANVVVQLEDATRALLARGSEIEAREQKIDVLTNEVDVATAAKLDVVVQLEEATHALLARDSEIAAREQKIGALTSELDKAVTAKLAFEFERTYLQQQLGSLIRIDRDEDMEQQRNVIELNERIRSLQQAHNDALSSVRHEYEVVLSEKRSLERERARRLSGRRPPRLSSEGAIRGSDLTNHLHCMGSPTSMPMRFPGKFRERANRTILPASRPSNDSLRRSSFERPGQQSTSKPFESPHPRNNWIAPQETPTLHQTVISCLET